MEPHPMKGEMHMGNYLGMTEEEYNEYRKKNDLRDTWPEIYEEGYRDGEPVIELTNGEKLIKRYGKYKPNVCFLLNDANKEIVWEDAPKDLFNIAWDSSHLEIMPGDFWLSKKGTKCFRPSKDGKHVLVRNNWGGCFEHSSGREFEEIKDLAIYARVARSNGGGAGNNYYVFPKDFRKEVSIDDI
jgi:hypothetical protein